MNGFPFRLRLTLARYQILYQVLTRHASHKICDEVARVTMTSFFSSDATNEKQRAMEGRSVQDRMNSVQRAITAFCVLFGLGLSAHAFAAETAVGSASNLPLPRFASLKSDRVNLREGPSKEHRTKWIYEKAGLPVEIIAEFETWRRIRDSEGAEGWVLHSLLSGRRTALVAPWGKDKPVALRSKPDDAAPMIAALMPNVLGVVRTCDLKWCRIVGEGAEGQKFDGYVPQSQLWGVYPDDKFD
jgi:SH3-like domain-containing protein